MLIYQSKEEVDVTKNIFSGLIQHFQHTYEYAEVTFRFMPNAGKDKQGPIFAPDILATFIAT